MELRSVEKSGMMFGSFAVDGVEGFVQRFHFLALVVVAFIPVVIFLAPMMLRARWHALDS
jgi:hypothetical protein